MTGNTDCFQKSTFPQVEISQPPTDTERAILAVYNGIDVVSIQRIADLLEEFGDSFATRSFTIGERRYCEQQLHPPEHYAARWAVKEAFLKILEEQSPAVSTDEIEVIREPSGPQLSLGPAASEALSARLLNAGVDPERTDRSVSLSHDRESDTAVAQVVVVAFGSDRVPAGGEEP